MSDSVKDEMPKSDPDRNADICRQYADGKTLEQIGDVYTLSRERIRQILRKAGVSPRAGRPALNDRGNFLSALVTDEARDAVEREAKRRGVSMSKVTSDAISAALKEK